MRSGNLRADSLDEKVESRGSKRRYLRAELWGERGRETFGKWVDGGRFVTLVLNREARKLRIEKSLSHSGLMRSRPYS